MIRINLLPHREAKRRARRQQFFATAGLVAVLAIAIIGLGWSVIAGYIGVQKEKNEFLKREIAALDKDIAQIKDLQEKIRLQVARKEIIESLQRDRSEPVDILNELAKQMPDGVYLKSFKQTGSNVTLAGFSQSNARVSTLMRNLESSEAFQAPRLVETKAATVSGNRLQEFSLNVAVTRTAAPVASTPAKVPAKGGTR